VASRPALACHPGSGSRWAIGPAIRRKINHQRKQLASEPGFAPSPTLGDQETESPTYALAKKDYVQC
jgi:hypothetical protein